MEGKINKDGVLEIKRAGKTTKWRESFIATMSISSGI